MSILKIYDDQNPQQCQTITDFKQIYETLKPAGIIFERWAAGNEVALSASAEEILETYQKDIKRLKKEKGFLTADVISLNPSSPDIAPLRAKFLDEHTHSEDEARFFIEGSGLFCIHLNNRVYALVCEKNDLINVPAGTKHWFDMGPRPSFKCIRLFTNKEGWVAQYTGDKIGSKFPLYENP